jgi:hypothetical protein
MPRRSKHHRHERDTRFISLAWTTVHKIGNKCYINIDVAELSVSYTHPNVGTELHRFIKFSALGSGHFLFRALIPVTSLHLKYWRERKNSRRS